MRVSKERVYRLGLAMNRYMNYSNKYMARMIINNSDKVMPIMEEGDSIIGDLRRYYVGLDSIRYRYNDKGLTAKEKKEVELLYEADVKQYIEENKEMIKNKTELENRFSEVMSEEIEIELETIPFDKMPDISAEDYNYFSLVIGE